MARHRGFPLTGEAYAGGGATDMQVVTAIQALGLDVFPFEAFDAYGRLKTPPVVDPALRAELDEATATPEWKAIAQRLALFDNPGHEATALGFRLRPDGVRLLAVRPIPGFNNNPELYRRWQFSLWDTVLRALQDELPRRPWVKQSWIDAIRKILELLKGESQVSAEPFLFEGVEPEQAKAAADQVVRAIELILSLLEIANRAGRAAKVECVVIWGYTGVPLTAETTRRYSSIGSVTNAESRAVVGQLWDRWGRTTWTWAQHSPWPDRFYATPGRVHRAFYPSVRLAEATPD